MVICTNCLKVAEKSDSIQHELVDGNCVGWLPMHIYLRRQRERLERQERKMKVLLTIGERLIYLVSNVKGPATEDVFRY